MDVFSVFGSRDILMWLNGKSDFLAVSCLIIIAFILIWLVVLFNGTAFWRTLKMSRIVMKNFFLKMSI